MITKQDIINYKRNSNKLKQLEFLGSMMESSTIYNNIQKLRLDQEKILNKLPQEDRFLDVAYWKIYLDLSEKN